MAIVNIREGYSGHEAGGDVDKRTAIRTFSLITDTPSDDAIFSWPQTINGITIPAPGYIYPGNSYLRSRQPVVKKISPCFFNVRVRYGPVDSTGKVRDEGYPENPLDVPAEERWDTVAETDRIDFDADGYPYCNAIGEPVEAEDEIVDQVLYLTRNEAAFDENTAYEWHRTVYDGVFRGVPKGRVLLKRLQFENIKNTVVGSEGYGNILYSRVSYELHFRWRTAPLKNGYIVNTTDQTKFSAIVDTPANASLYAFYRRYLHTGYNYYDSQQNLHKVDTGEPVPISADYATRGNLIGTIVGGKPVLDLGNVHWMYRKRYPFVEWLGLA